MRDAGCSSMQHLNGASTAAAGNSNRQRIKDIRFMRKRGRGGEEITE